MLRSMMVGCVVRFVGASPTQNEQGQPVGSFDLKFTTQQRRRLGFGTQPIRSGSQRPPLLENSQIPKPWCCGVASLGGFQLSPPSSPRICTSGRANAKPMRPHRFRSFWMVRPGNVSRIRGATPAIGWRPWATCCSSSTRGGRCWCIALAARTVHRLSDPE